MQELHPDIEMPLAMALMGPPDDSFQTDCDLIVWIYGTGGWIRFRADRMMDWGKPGG